MLVIFAVIIGGIATGQTCSDCVLTYPNSMWLRLPLHDGAQLLRTTNTRQVE